MKYVLKLDSKASSWLRYNKEKYIAFKKTVTSRYLAEIVVRINTFFALYIRLLGSIAMMLQSKVAHRQKVRQMKQFVTALQFNLLVKNTIGQNIKIFVPEYGSRNYNLENCTSFNL